LSPRQGPSPPPGRPPDPGSASRSATAAWAGPGSRPPRSRPADADASGGPCRSPCSCRPPASSVRGAWLLLPLPGLPLGPLRHDAGVVAPVEEDHAVQFLAPEDGPAAPLGGVHLVVAVPGPLDGRPAVPRRQPAVHPAVDVAELELAAPVGDLD